MNFVRTMIVATTVTGLVAFTGLQSADARTPCQAPQSVCDVRDSVFRVSGFNPFGSAVRIGPDLLVTNRHLVADKKTITVFTETGKVSGTVITTGFHGDLVLVTADLPDGPVLPVADVAIDADMRLRTVGYDLGSRTVRVYSDGGVLGLPDRNAPLSMIHHTAHTQPGNSGGALVDETGRLVGIVTSGGAGVFEALPARAVMRLRDAERTDASGVSDALGQAFRHCSDATDAVRSVRGALPKDLTNALTQSCPKTYSRQLIDLAAQALGRARMFDESERLFRQALEMDPNAINTRLGLATTLMFGGRPDAARSHIRKLLVIVPANPTVHRMAVQAGRQTGDRALVATALDAIKTHNPQGLEAAKRFLATPPRTLRPRPKPDQPATQAN